MDGAGYDPLGMGQGSSGVVRPRRPRLPWPQPQYPPALERFTTGFGMGPGGPAPPSATGGPHPPRVAMTLRVIQGSVRDRCCDDDGWPHCGRSALARGGARAPTRGMRREPSAVSTAWLRPLPGVHRRPRHPVVCGGPYALVGLGRLIWGRASRLDAVSGYPCQARLPGGARCRTTGPPAARPARSSRTRAGAPQSSNARGG